MTGQVVHEWNLPYSQVWDDTAAVRNPRPDSQIYLEKAHLLPNGNLLAIYVAVGDSPWGYGLVEMDRDSKVVWKYLQQTHHDFDVGADGKIYALTHAIRTDVVPGQEHLAPPRIDDYAVVLSPDGQELKKVWLLGALANSPYASFLSTVPWYIAQGKGDYLHTNSIDVIEEGVAQALPFAAQGQVLLSFREIGTLAVLDFDRQQIVWALRGPWLRQHDAEALANGHLMVFDNEGQGGDVSRVLEFDPNTLQITWRYAGDPEHAFFSRVRSAEQRLPNGNTLITESDGGRLLEVTPAGEIVWQFVNPVRGGEKGELIPIFSWGQRIDPAGLDPSFRELVNSTEGGLDDESSCDDDFGRSTRGRRDPAGGRLHRAGRGAEPARRVLGPPGRGDGGARLRDPVADPAPVRAQADPAAGVDPCRGTHAEAPGGAD